VRLTEHFELAEFVVSQTAERAGIDNTPPAEVVERLRYVATCLEGIRAILGKPVVITSGYRCPELNRRIGGAKSSQHLRGEAADWVCPGWGRPAELVRYLVTLPLAYDQLILEFPNSSSSGWVHTSWVRDKPRHQALVIDGDGARAYA
jgi:zinc D-Ala-D-Ala carboxypeptidase